MKIKILKKWHQTIYENIVIYLDKIFTYQPLFREYINQIIPSLKKKLWTVNVYPSTKIK